MHRAVGTAKAQLHESKLVYHQRSVLKRYNKLVKKYAQLYGVCKVGRCKSCPGIPWSTRVCSDFIATP